MKYILINITSYFQEITKVQQAKFNSLIGLFLAISLIGCNAEVKQSTIEINKADLVVNPSKGLVYYMNKPFDGVSVKYYPNQQMAESIQYKEGIRNGAFMKWYANGQISYEAHYQNGLLDGISSTWWKTGIKRSQSHFKKGVSEGVQKQWYQSGAIFKEITLVNGKEEGLQKAYRENGKIYNNYEAKNGRIFGLKRANLCYELDDEVIQNKK